MGVNPLPTGGIYKSFTFDGETSASFGVHLTGEGVYNAPVRAVEMVNVPARNGAFALDQGYFENIEVTYTASIAADNEADFSAAVSDLRNFLCSKNGYCRLEDDYNPNEYRMAVYKSGLEVAQFRNITGEFDIVFDCKPQRFLKSGETAISVTSGDTITNPTRFDARPQLQVWGHGDISINGKAISVEDSTIGNTLLSGGGKHRRIAIDMSMMNVGDVFSVELSQLFRFSTFSAYKVVSCEITSATNCTVTQTVNTNSINFVATITPMTCNNGTPQSQTGSFVASIIVDHNGTQRTVTYTTQMQTSYDGTNEIEQAESITVSPYVAWIITGGDLPVFSQIFGNSTKSANGNPMYIDLGLGECWNEDYGTPVSVNNAVTLPAELPALASGVNTITYDNTITQLDIVPRWWKV